MGTEASIVLYAESRETAERAATAAFARMAVLDSLLSDYRADGELARVHEAAGREAVPVSDALLHVLARALDLARETDGAFDPTAGPLTLLWRDARRNRTLPHPDSVAAALDRTGWQHVELDAVARTLRLAHPHMRIDLGGIAKGYAVDEVLATLRTHGIRRALVSFGGEIAAGEPPPDADAWTVALTDPQSDDGAGPAHSVSLVREAVSTSGDTEQFIELGGTRYSHVLDPRTGWPLTTRVRVTVRAPQAWRADAYATAASVLTGPDRAAFVVAHPEAAFRIGTERAPARRP